MQQQLISLSPDLKQLRDEGYELEIRGGYLVIRHIPYVTTQKTVKMGMLISELTLSNPNLAGKPSTHALFFMGDIPCHRDGSPIREIINSSNNAPLTAGLIGNHFLSSKPASGYYNNYYDKITRYAEIISAPAMVIDPGVTARPFTPIADTEEESVFQYIDTNSSRANIVQLNDKFKGQKIAIIGLGGTGAYILDLVAKTPVKEIHLFDGDVLSQHNAFRSPGAAGIAELNTIPLKVNYYAAIYSRLHKKVIPHAEFLSADNIESLRGMTMVFICVDKNSVRTQLISLLLTRGIPFIDVGLGVNIVDGQLIGTVRITAGTPEKRDHLANRIAGEDQQDNDYVTNIQIADLNALNAVMAVIRWKKKCGFYQDLIGEHHSTYSINVAQLLNEDTAA